MRTAFIVAALGLSAVLGACEERGVQEHRASEGVQRVPVATPAPAAAGTDAAAPTGGAVSPPMPGASTPPARGAVPQAGAGEFAWRVPEGWVLDPTPRQMRVATYRAPDAAGEAEVAVTRFPGNVGGELANVNRWRGQMGLEPLDEARLGEVLEREAVGAWSLYHARVEGTGAAEGKVMLASAAFDPAAGETWFVRTTVARDAAERLVPSVRELARAIAGGGAR